MKFREELRRIRKEAERASADKELAKADEQAAKTAACIEEAKEKIRRACRAGTFEVRLMTILEFDADNIRIPDGGVEFRGIGVEYLQGPAAALRDFLEKERLRPRLHTRRVRVGHHTQYVEFDFLCNAWT